MELTSREINFGHKKTQLNWSVISQQVPDKRGIIDHRLGGKEAPPALVSVSLGLNFEEHLENIDAHGSPQGYG